MNFNEIYKLTEAEGALSTGDSNIDALHQKEKNASAALVQIVKQFKDDPKILEMMEFYDNKKKKKESLDTITKGEHLTEAVKFPKKPSFKAYYKMIIKSTNNINKKVAIGVLVVLIAVGAAVSLKVLQSVKKPALGDIKDTGNDNGNGGNAGGSSPNPNPTEGSNGTAPSADTDDTKQVDQSVVDDVVAGKYGVGEERKAALEKAGYDPNEVQAAVNKDPKAIQATKDWQAQKAQNAGNAGNVEINGATMANEPTANNAGATDSGENNTEQANNGYSNWVNDPKNKKTVDQLKQQATAAGKDPDEVLKRTYANGTNVNNLRSVEKSTGVNDISGKGRSDKNMAKSIAKSQGLAKAESDPNVQAYMNYLKSSNPKKFGNVENATQLAGMVGANSGLMEYKQGDNGSGQWVYKQGVSDEIKQGYKTLQAAKKGK